MRFVPPGLLQLSADRPANTATSRSSGRTAASPANLFQCGLGDFCYRASPPAIFTVGGLPFSSAGPHSTSTTAALPAAVTDVAVFRSPTDIHGD